MDWSKTLTHKLTDSWTPDKAMNNLITIMTHSYAMYPTMPLQCSVHRGFGDFFCGCLYVYSTLKAQH